MSDQDRKHKWPRKLVEMVDAAEQALVNHGLEQPQAGELAGVVVKAIAWLHGGRVFYLPKAGQIDCALRDREIWKRFGGHNHEELSREYDLNVIQIYRILAKQRELNRSNADE